MAYRQGGRSGNKAMVQPINIIFRFYQTKARVQFWLYEQTNMRIEGIILGFDEYMNMVLDDAVERHMKTGNEKRVGRIMLKGESISLLQGVDIQ